MGGLKPSAQLSPRGPQVLRYSYVSMVFPWVFTNKSLSFSPKPVLSISAHSPHIFLLGICSKRSVRQFSNPTQKSSPPPFTLYVKHPLQLFPPGSVPIPVSSSLSSQPHGA